MAPPKGKSQIRLGSLMFTLTMERLMQSPASNYDLADHTGMHYITVSRLMRMMHARKVVHVAAWVKSPRTRYIERVWALGSGMDAERPKRDRSEYNRQRYAHQRKHTVRTAWVGNSPFAEAR
jgi:hypothetical protein